MACHYSQMLFAKLHFLGGEQRFKCSSPWTIAAMHHDWQVGKALEDRQRFLPLLRSLVGEGQRNFVLIIKMDIVGVLGGLPCPLHDIHGKRILTVFHAPYIRLISYRIPKRIS